MSITSCPFGTSGFECSFVIYIIPAVFVLVALLFRKNVANDTLGMGFSVLGSTIPSLLAYYILFAFFHSFKWSLIAGLLLFFIGGFLLAELIGDGEA